MPRGRSASREFGKNCATKRIAFVTTLPRSLHAFVRSESDQLIRRGWDVTWISAVDSRAEFSAPPGVRHVSVPMKRGIDPFGLLAAIIALYRIFRREKFDIVQYSTPNASFYASTAALAARVPVRLYAQGGVRYLGFSGMPRTFFRLLEAWTCRCSTLVEPVSRSNLDFCVGQGLYPRDKARIVWNGSACGVDLGRFQIEKKEEWRTEWRRRIGLEACHLVVGFVGSIRRDKGCNELLEACRSLSNEMPDVRLILVGDMEFGSTLRPALMSWFATSSRVVHIGPTSEVPQFMACMDVLALPSYREGFGLVIVEAEAMGVPVVVSDVPGPVDAMVQGQTGIAVPVRDVSALEAALRELLCDAEKRRTYGAAGTAFARENFAQTEFMRRVCADKEMLLEESRRRRVYAPDDL